MRFPWELLAVVLLPAAGGLQASQVAGRMIDNSSSNGFANSRVTLFTPDFRFFRARE